MNLKIFNGKRLIYILLQNNGLLQGASRGKSEVDEDFIYDSFSEKVGDLLIDTFESSINMIDEPADFKEKLEDAVKNL